MTVLFPARLYDAIRGGAVTVAFRSWRRPTVTTGGTLQTPAGLLSIDDVAVIEVEDITAADAAAAGATSIDEVLASLRAGPDRSLHRIRFHRLGDDPRLALRDDTDLSDRDRDEIAAQLQRWDARSPDGPWTTGLIDLVAANPGRPSRELAVEAGTDQLQLKRRVRQLKGLGLTESLTVGYRLSRRGEAVRRGG